MDGEKAFAKWPGERDMMVEGIGNAAAAAKLTAKATGPKGTGETSAQEASSVAAQEDSRAKGVLRLLQEGHFKGVADVRLRINFHEELTAIAHENLVPVVEGKVAGIISMESPAARKPAPRQRKKP